MKTRLATGLAVAGVLVAGTAAALANTQILDGGGSTSGASAAVLPDAEPIDLTIPASSPPSTSEPATTSSTPTSSPSPDSTSEFLTTFNVGSAGSVTVDVIAGRLRLVESAPGAGWSVAKSEENTGDNEVEVEFRSSASSVEFEAQLIDGEIVPHVSSSSLVDDNSAPSTPNTISDDDEHDDDSHYDDDHDDEHDDEEHERDDD